MSHDHDDPALATLLAHNVEVILQSLRGEDGRSAPLSALVAARTAGEVLTDVTRTLVTEARRAGHTWAEIGRLLRISRQAAQQRFGSAEVEVVADGDALSRRAIEIVEQMRDGNWPAIAVDWDDIMHEKLTVEDVSKVWTRLARNAGRLRAIGRPSVLAKGLFRVAEVPLAFEHGPMRARVTFNRDHTVAGLWIMQPDESE